MRYAHGISASCGRAIGPLAHVCHTRACVARRVFAPHQELLRLDNATKQAQEELRQLAQKTTQSGREILMVQQVMLDDVGLCAEMRGYIQAGAGAAAAAERAGRLYAQRLRALKDAYLSARACDVLDVCQRVVRILDGISPMQLTCPSILMSDEIYPTDLVASHDMVLGFVSSRGSPQAHAAILARAYGIPAVVQTDAAFLMCCHGQLAALDGASADIYLAPDAAQAARFAGSIAANRQCAAGIFSKT
ncbi:MAG: phosphoenolpyruvate-utilizing N-terminal domain-containing protein [Ruthenibacterium sp.]